MAAAWENGAKMLTAAEEVGSFPHGAPVSPSACPAASPSARAAAKGLLPVSTAPVLRRPPTPRELAAHRIAERLDRPIATLGVAALGLWLAEPLTSSDAALNVIVEVVWVGIALAFLVEFIIRAIVAPETWPFLRQHWWELGLVALPFLRFLSVLRAGRAARVSPRPPTRAGESAPSSRVA